MDDDAFCGLDEPPEDAVKVKTFNRWLARAMRHHVLPLKDQTARLEATLEKHIHEEELMLAKIQGGVSTLKWMVPVLNIVIPALALLVVYLMHKAGIV